jgi:predicted GIY-YIG superfamily endonuclease
MTKWKVYILRCNDGSLYTGITTDIKKRLKRHNDGKASKYTRVKKPVEIVYTEDAINATSAKKT